MTSCLKDYDYDYDYVFFSFMDEACKKAESLPDQEFWPYLEDSVRNYNEHYGLDYDPHNAVLTYMAKKVIN